ncbi:Eco57I restriction-modification methylase domain-containing protein [Rhodovibrio sodomensis]|uniref:Eco57I restriction-modification methylase domain-containing protein n=1 Tax=Rhodovibrio sodomensis TaxID=1088 RepID=UPI001906BA23|nr:Eco57I restriction-modification methylase domain-containing protein [Rhodovibrio sodomensis]
MPETLAAVGGSGGFAFPASDLPVYEQVKTRSGRFAEGFDFVVGNPPYIRADEQQTALDEYRDEIRLHHAVQAVRTNLFKKWDMFVPFVTLGLYLLRSGVNRGRFAMIPRNSASG